VILRAAGIYGPGRGHLFLQYLKGEATLTGAGDRWLNMVHRDDLVGACVAALERGQAGGVYNVADSEPVTEREFFRWLAGALNRPMPSAADPALKLRKRGATSKRISNRRLLTELRYRMIHPTFREGYTAEIKRLQLNT
jgi:nucleoside-diphosphate-sugar epimerase